MSAMSQSKEHKFRLKEKKIILLVGLMGSGKTSVGRILAKTLSLPFLDSDKEIEKASNLSISDLFASYGEEEFRKGEERIMERLMTGKQCVLSSGGGAFLSKRTRALSKKTTLSIWIKADLDILCSRTQGKKHRPLVPSEDNRDALRHLIEESYPLYEEADLCVDSCEESPYQTVLKIMPLLKEVGFIED